MCAVTLGISAAVATDREHIEWARQVYSSMDRDSVFDPVRMGEAAQYVSQIDRKVYGPSPRFSGCQRVSGGLVRQPAAAP
jgi:hypothetical protein